MCDFNGIKNVRGRPEVIVQTLPISKRTNLQPKFSFFVLFVGFPIAKLLFSIKEWGKKVKLGKF